MLRTTIIDIMKAKIYSTSQRPIVWGFWFWNVISRKYTLYLLLWNFVATVKGNKMKKNVSMLMKGIIDCREFSYFKENVGFFFSLFYFFFLFFILKVIYETLFLGQLCSFIRKIYKCSRSRNPIITFLISGSNL